MDTRRNEEVVRCARERERDRERDRKKRSAIFITRLGFTKLERGPFFIDGRLSGRDYNSMARNVSADGILISGWMDNLGILYYVWRC